VNSRLQPLTISTWKELFLQPRHISAAVVAELGFLDWEGVTLETRRELRGSGVWENFHAFVN